MTVQADDIGEYDLLFHSLKEAVQDLEDAETGATVRLCETNRLAEEIENLRAITEQMAEDSMAMRSITVG